MGFQKELPCVSHPPERAITWIPECLRMGNVSLCLCFPDQCLQSFDGPSEYPILRESCHCSEVGISGLHRGGQLVADRPPADRLVTDPSHHLLQIPCLQSRFWFHCATRRSKSPIKKVKSWKDLFNTLLGNNPPLLIVRQDSSPVGSFVRGVDILFAVFDIREIACRSLLRPV